MGGSLWGHIDEGVAFIILGSWWMYNVFKRYIQAGGTDRYETSLSYDIEFRGRKLNFEIYAKIFVSTGGLLIELFNNGAHISFMDENGSFYRISSLQHMSIYTLFILNGVIDLLRYKKLLIVEGLEYLSLSIAFAWYGLVFYFHTSSGHADKMETVIHSLGIVWCFGAALSLMWECRTVDKFLPNYCRSLMVLSLGTWFFHMPFYLYDSRGFPGSDPNPAWDRNDHGNAQFIATMFGFHVLFNVILSLLSFTVVRLVYTRISGGAKSHVMFHRIPNDVSELEEKSCLLEEEL